MLSHMPNATVRELATALAKTAYRGLGNPPDPDVCGLAPHHRSPPGRYGIRYTRHQVRPPEHAASSQLQRRLRAERWNTRRVRRSVHPSPRTYPSGPDGLRRNVRRCKSLLELPTAHLFYGCSASSTSSATRCQPGPGPGNEDAPIIPCRHRHAIGVDRKRERLFVWVQCSKASMACQRLLIKVLLNLMGRWRIRDFLNLSGMVTPCGNRIGLMGLFFRFP